MTQLYRLRSIDHVLGEYKELERQEIYFAEPSELNDPMEGFRDIFWMGDHIVWKNLFRHYIYCLHTTCVISRFIGNTAELRPQHIPIMSDVPQDWTQKGVDLFNDICDRVFQRTKLIEFANKIANSKRKVRRDELLFYLYSLHHIALHEIEVAYADHGLASNRPSSPSRNSNFVHPHQFQEILRKAEEDGINSEDIFKASALIVEQISLGHKLALESSERHDVGINRQFLVLDFTKKYVERLESLLYPKWHVACLLRNYRNSSTWGNYADNHKGICLIFRTDHDGITHSINLNKVTGYSNKGEQWNYAPLTVYEVTYGNAHDEIDFFRSLGRLPESKALDIWYKDSTGLISECGSHIGENMNSWREDYWRSFYPSINIKTRDWEYEQESRLVLFSMLSDLTEKRHRKLNYRFESLDGIIFGIRTSDSDKLRILEVLKKKCRENSRADFQVFQAYYDHKVGNIGKYPMNVKLSE